MTSLKRISFSCFCLAKMAFLRMISCKLSHRSPFPFWGYAQSQRWTCSVCKSVIQMLEKQKKEYQRYSGGLVVLLERLQSRPIHVENAQTKRREPTSVMSFSILQDFSVSALLTWLLSKKQHLWHMHWKSRYFGNLGEVWFYWLRRFS